MEQALEYTMERALEYITEQALSLKFRYIIETGLSNSQVSNVRKSLGVWLVGGSVVGYRKMLQPDIVIIPIAKAYCR